jgi:calcineurin-like phosphoesterase family protein
MEVDSYTSTGEKVSLVLCHYAMRVWNKAHYSVRLAYGHSHSTLPDDPNSLSMDVGVDNIAKLLAVDGSLKQEGYRPISIDEFEVYMSKKTWKPKDHHGRE